MRKLLSLLVALLAALAPATADADGGGILGGTKSFTDPPYRYVALTPRTSHPLTLVERIDLRDSTIDRWWYLRGSYYLPAVATDGSPGGISANGVLPLISLPRRYPPQHSQFALLDTRLFLRHPHRGQGSHPLQPAGCLRLRRDLARRVAAVPDPQLLQARRSEPLRSAGARCERRAAATGGDRRPAGAG